MLVYAVPRGPGESPTARVQQDLLDSSSSQEGAGEPSFTPRIEQYNCSLQACLFALARYGTRVRPDCGRRTRLKITPPSSLAISQGWGLIDLLLRASFSPAHPVARRDVPLARARGSFRPRVARAQKIIRLHPLFCSGSNRPTRAPFRPLYRGGSASKKDGWLPPRILLDRAAQSCEAGRGWRKST